MNYPYLYKYLATVCLSTVLSLSAVAQAPFKPTASDIMQGMQKLSFLGSVLYVAAHPDDENTRMIAYLANEYKANTAYLSLTRGDGGQNLIGPEIREYLGVIRTEELLAARRLDGGRQFFSRANDFGYSKSPEETFNIWDRDAVLADVVWTLRKFRPDVIINRFPGDGRGRHGHHTASAILSKEAFNLANDPKQYPEQLQYVDTWQVKRLFTNTGRWWNNTISSETPGVLTIDVGKYNPLLGRSYTEIAAFSRSQHKSQGFGSTGSRGGQEEFLEFEMGEPAKKDLFEGIDTSWGRVEGGEAVAPLVEKAIKQFDPTAPDKSVPALLAVRKAIAKTKDPYWKNQKIGEVDRLLQWVTGLYLEAKTDNYYLAPGVSTTINFELTNRSSAAIKVNRITIPELGIDKPVAQSMGNNEQIKLDAKGLLAQNKAISGPYWLKESGSLGMYKVNEQTLIGTPQNRPAYMATVTLEIEGQQLSYEIPVIYKWNDPVDGESYRPLEVVPAVSMNISENAYIFADNTPQPVAVTLKSGKAKLSGEISLKVPKGWEVTPASQSFEIQASGGEKQLVFMVTPPQQQSMGVIKAEAVVNGKKYDRSIKPIAYKHIPNRTLFPEAKAQAVRLDIKTVGKRIGYIQGAGDEIPASLRNIGYDVWEMEDEDILPANLKALDAVVLGIRAINTRERLKHTMQSLLDYVEQGGTLILQYNTRHRLLFNEFAPYPLTLSRDRVTVEEAPVRMLLPDHPVLNYPNKITSKDFDGWVQERGLYFPNQWDNKYQAILSSNDPGETPKDGGLLVAKHGKGYYVYSGYSWFRELPAGVPGAYRIFANLIALGQNDKPTDPVKKKTKGKQKKSR